MCVADEIGHNLKTFYLATEDKNQKLIKRNYKTEQSKTNYKIKSYKEYKTKWKQSS